MAFGKSMTVELVGGAPWGFRLGGGADFGIPLEIAKIRKKSKADAAGLQEGDLVTRIDNQDVGKKSHGEAMTIIEAAGSQLVLSISRSADVSGISIPINQPAASTPTDFRPQPPAVSFSMMTSSPLPTASFNSSIRGYNTQPTTTSWRVQSESTTKTVNQDRDKRVTIVSQNKVMESSSGGFSPAVSVPCLPLPRQLWPATTAQLPPQASVTPSPPANVSRQPLQPWTVQLTSYSLPILNQPAVKPAFRVKKLDVKKVVWSPAGMMPETGHRVVYQLQPMTSAAGDLASEGLPQFYILPNGQGASQEPSQQPRASSQPPQQQQQPKLYDDNEYEATPASFHIPMPPPLQDFTDNLASAKKKIPGMVNPLITEHGQGSLDTVCNRTSRKKVYSDSSFYDAPGMEYPTMDEQVEMCKKIAVLLDSDRNRESRGGRMFARRKENADQWSMESHAASKPNLGMSWSYDGGSALGDFPLFEFRNPLFGYNQVRQHPAPIKSHLTTQDLENLKANEGCLVKHDSLPPNLAFDISTALTRSSGKGAKIFARRRERADKFVVDENNVRKPQPASPQPSWTPQQSRLFIQTRSPSKPMASPWDAAMEGNLDKAFEHLTHYKMYDVIEVPTGSHSSVMSTSLPPGSPFFAPSYSSKDVVDTLSSATPKLQVHYKPFQSVRPPGTGRQWASSGSDLDPESTGASHGQTIQLQPSGSSRAQSEPWGTTHETTDGSFNTPQQPSYKSYNAVPRGFGVGSRAMQQPQQQGVAPSAGISAF